MGQLHELLAVEANLKGHGDRVSKETMTNFTKKDQLFKGKTRNYQPINDEGEKFPDEDVTMTTTVPARLQYTWDAVIAAIDATYQKEVTNTVAKADLELDGETLIAQVPATALLTLETKLKEIRALVEKAPTLEPGKGWTKDDAQENTWKSKEVVTIKTKKIEDFKTVAAATKEHPAQVAKVVRDETVGRWHQTEISGEITSDEKMKMLTRIDNIFREVKKARARANTTDVVTDIIGKKILDYVMDNKKK